MLSQQKARDIIFKSDLEGKDLSMDEITSYYRLFLFAFESQGKLVAEFCHMFSRHQELFTPDTFNGKITVTVTHLDGVLLTVVKDFLFNMVSLWIPL